MVRSNKNQQRAKLDIQIEEFWKQSMKIPNWENKEMEKQVKESIQLDKHVDQKKRKVQDPRKLQT